MSSLPSNRSPTSGRTTNAPFSFSVRRPPRPSLHLLTLSFVVPPILSLSRSSFVLSSSSSAILSSLILSPRTKNELSCPSSAFDFEVLSTHSSEFFPPAARFAFRFVASCLVSSLLGRTYGDFQNGRETREKLERNWRREEVRCRLTVMSSSEGREREFKKRL